ncbi:MAG: hypothetical protein HKN25_03180 [Pyrinomonadaceae bacterium]|nr:hypothetical protein [Pyrinomonadaceae bacterium]
MIQTPNGLWNLFAEVSVPKMLFGHNSRLPKQDEVAECLKMITEYVESVTALPFNARQATVAMIHFAYDLHLSKADVLPIIHNLSSRTLKHLEKLFYNDSTLYFQNKKKSRIIRIYSKWLEVLSRKDATEEENNAAIGVLRVEVCLMKARTINAFVKKHSLPAKRSVNLIDQKISMCAILEILDELDFFELVTNEKSDLELLLERYNARTAMTLTGFNEMVGHFGERFYKDESFGFSKHCYYSDARKCRDAKIWKRRTPKE